MLRTMLKSKIHRATITRADLHYVGSITLDEDLMDAAGVLPHELVTVADIDNGNRLDTYAIPGRRGSGVVAINGAAAHLVSEGHLVIVMNYAQYTDEEARALKPAVVFVDSENKIVDIGAQPAAAPAGSGLVDGRLA